MLGLLALTASLQAARGERATLLGTAALGLAMSFYVVAGILPIRWGQIGRCRGARLKPQSSSV